ncbi:hypothetical protein IQ268_02970 [Oculatella sp. LEGE 06141]|uniref:hypothetical protein n=1 Tax=Oculatella sp. LEGE 06141 TaxID=1828648 RepID=UPI00187F759D|nr:hypothetical protein [Oculatella sp. LEGE 06141]MBE9177538.1 hypothetical protein [Oculatella sp. LEGE 06141]
MRTSGQIKAEIEEHLGFFPPFFAPALHTPQVLENLWQQTLLAYINNPLPALFKEKLSAYLSRYCSVPYCMICHSCALYPLGMQASDILAWLELPPPTRPDVEQHLERLATQPEWLAVWTEKHHPALEESLLACTIFIAQEQEAGQECRQALSHLLEPAHYQSLVMLIAYIKTCLVWMEAHPQVACEVDQRIQKYLGS